MFFSKMIAALASFASMATAMPDNNRLQELTFSRSLASTNFRCPGEMTYCSWTKSCSCAPGMYWDRKAGRCKGTALEGAWPMPSLAIYGSVDAKLGAFCARSPYEIVPYHASHSYCKASVENVVFLAPIEIEAELKLKAGLEIDIKVDCSIALKQTCAGLAGLYLESVHDAVALFNTEVYGLAVHAEGVVGALTGGILKAVKSLTCLLGVTECHPYDCVSYCTKGCKNYIDVKGEVGGLISGLVGFIVLPDVIYIVGAAGSIITVAVKSLLCVVGLVVNSLLSNFNCNCA
ncbi:hypothetical protein BGZ63DRAFT_420808 [Mariannaea sp. PMI_226]|nr:hypothetical protein BGZ63DRAFT_420808 [Mariannaea sp. PMI_226]